MRIYVPAPRLKKRVRPYDVERSPSGLSWSVPGSTWYLFRDQSEGVEWFRDFAAAKAEADAALHKYITSLEAQIARLEAQIAKLKGLIGEDPDA